MIDIELQLSINRRLQKLLEDSKYFNFYLDILEKERIGLDVCEQKNEFEHKVSNKFSRCIHQIIDDCYPNLKEKDPALYQECIDFSHSEFNTIKKILVCDALTEVLVSYYKWPPSD